MAVVASITLDHEGNPTSGQPGDVLIGDRVEHVENVVRRLINIAERVGAEIEHAVIREHAEAIVDAHTIVAPGESIPAAVEPEVAPEPAAPAE